MRIAHAVPTLRKPGGRWRWFKDMALGAAARQDRSQHAVVAPDGHTATTRRLLSEAHYGQALVDHWMVVATTEWEVRRAVLADALAGPPEVVTAEAAGELAADAGGRTRAAWSATARAHAAAAARERAVSASREQARAELDEIDARIAVVRAEADRVRRLWRVNFDRQAAVYARAFLDRGDELDSGAIPPFRPADGEDLEEIARLMGSSRIAGPPPVRRLG